MNKLRLIAASVKAAAGKPRKLAIAAYGGGVMRVSGFGPLVIDLTEMDFAATIPVLADHDATIGGTVGPGTPTVVNGQLFIDCTVADSEAGAAVVKLLEGGTPLEASVGVDPTERQPVRAGETVKVNGRSITADDDGFMLITKSTLRECSVLPLAADPGTSVSLAARRAKGAAMNYKAMLRATAKFTDDEIEKMTPDEAKAALKKCMKAETDPNEPDEDDKPAEAAALGAILKGGSQPLLTRAMREGWGVVRAKAEALEYLRAARPSGNYTPSGSHADSPDTIQAALAYRAAGEKAALAAYGERAVQSARTASLHTAPFSELFAAHLRANGIDPGPRRDLAGMILAAGPSSAILTNLLSNVQNKILEQQWIQAPGTWRSWCAQRPAKDFKPSKSMKPVFTGQLTRLNPNGEIEHGSLSDFNIDWQIFEFAKMFTIGRVAIINDDLSGLSEIPMGLALMADRLVSDLVYFNLLNNTGTFFSTGNGNNSTGGGSVLSSAALTIAIKKLRLQTGPNGAPLSITPKTLVCGPELEQTAKELIKSSWQLRDQSADRQQTGNPFFDAVALEVEPRISLGATDPVTKATVAGSTTGWYLFADSVLLPGVIGFLNGQSAPTIQLSDPLGYNFETPGQSYRCIYDCGYSNGDFRAAQRSVGA